ncbi:iron chelate uptake ABC transporter family permease subunit [Nitrobacter sp.]|uniref:iron chelate uptake ABC transporter family permease subunit n=1 Tax=Nitrobacter sp. TaxID=29420 RepID=UPI00399D5DE8
MKTADLSQADSYLHSSIRSDLLLTVLFLALVALILMSLTIGRYPVPIGEVARIAFTTLPFDAVGSYDDKSLVVVEIIRMPRIPLVTICGMGLALSGAAMQGVFRNPLVGPEIAGVTTGPDVRELHDIRNALEHKFLQVYAGWARPFMRAAPSSEGLGFSIDSDFLETKALRVMKIARSALIQTALAVGVEERARKRPETFVASMSLFGLDDRRKRRDPM